MTGTAKQLSRARAAVNKRMLHHADTVRVVPATYDTPADLTVVHLVQQACLYEEKMATERDEEGGVTRTRTARIFFPVGTDVTANDLITSVSDQSSMQRLPVDADGNVKFMAVDGDPVNTGGWLECALVGVEGAR